MNRASLYKIVVSLTVTLLAAWCPRTALGATLSLYASCERSPYYQSNEILFLFDRTSVLDQDSRQAFNDGVKKIFLDQNVFGRLSIYEIRDFETETRHWGDGCIDTSEPSKNTEPVISRNFLGMVGTIESWIDTHWLSDQDDSNDDADVKAEDVRNGRSNVINYLASLISKDDPTPTYTEISQTLVSSMTSECNGVAECYVYIYSNLLDSAVERDYKRGENMAEAGRARASSLLAEYQPSFSKTNISIGVWGVGLADVTPGQALDDDKREAVRKFWSAYFGTICHSTTGSCSFSISDYLP